MKLNNTTLLLILISVLILSTFTGNVLEGMENASNSSGIKKSEIPKGDEDLYILKSQALVPSCPICPEINNEVNNKCAPCPPCGRCPEPAFECKKVPNYKRFSQNNEFKPMLADFSSFAR